MRHIIAFIFLHFVGCIAVAQVGGHVVSGPITIRGKSLNFKYTENGAVQISGAHCEDDKGISPFEYFGVFSLSTKCSFGEESPKPYSFSHLSNMNMKLLFQQDVTDSPVTEQEMALSLKEFILKKKNIGLKVFSQYGTSIDLDSCDALSTSAVIDQSEGGKTTISCGRLVESLTMPSNVIACRFASGSFQEGTVYTLTVEEPGGIVNLRSSNKFRGKEDVVACREKKMASKKIYDCEAFEFDQVKGGFNSMNIEMIEGELSGAATFWAGSGASTSPQPLRCTYL